MNQKPSVFPTPEQRAEIIRNSEKTALEAYEAEKQMVTSEIYQNAKSAPQTINDVPENYDPNSHGNSVEMMKRRTEEQMRLRNEVGVVKHPELAEKSGNVKFSQEEYEMNKRTEEQMRLRDEAIANNLAQTAKYHQQSEASMAGLNKNPNQTILPQNQQQNTYQNMQQNSYQQQPPVVPPVVPPTNNYGGNYGQNPSSIDPYIFELSQPNYNSPFDVIPLPSGGKTYRTKKANIRVAYMTTADENILTSPNLLQSGQFLEILINRKILEPGLRYKDLLVGDRNAIMIWLRATGYGEMYPVTLFDENDVPFDTEINLDNLKTKELGAEPDEEGLFHFQFPLSKVNIKFKMLTCGEQDDLERILDQEKENGIPVNNQNTYTLERMIVEVNGSRDRNEIREFSNSIRIRDAREFNEYLNKIECGIDLNITVGTPGGGSVATFLPLNLKFFWPNIGL
jgi:hypothetical protein